MTEKRFIVIDDGLDFMVRDTFAGDDLIDADGVADVLNDYDKENEQLKRVIVENEKLIQSTYDELTKLRCFKKNILRIKHSWDYLIEAIQYD